MANQYELFQRYVRLVIGPIDVSSLDAYFNIEKNLSKEPNKCELQIYNLNPSKRKALATQKNLPIEIKAGYLGMNAAPINDAEFLIFKGDIQQIFSTKEGPDWITTLRTADGIDARQNSRLTKSYNKGHVFRNIAKDLIEAYRVDGKKALSRIAKGDLEGALGTVLNGYTVTGAVNRELDKLLEKMGCSGSVQDGELIILKPKETLGTEAIVLTPDTGLVASPEIDNNGFLRCRSLLRPEFKPGYEINVQSDSINGSFRIERVNYTGSTFETIWYADLEASPL